LLLVVAGKILRDALEVEIQNHIHFYTQGRMEGIPRHGHHKKRIVRTGLGTVSLNIPRTRNYYISKLVPPYRRDVLSLDADMVQLYLKSVLRENFMPVLEKLFPQGPPWFSSATLQTMNEIWKKENQNWRGRKTPRKGFSRLWVNRLRLHTWKEPSNVWMLTGSHGNGNKEMIALEADAKSAAARYQA
jgi:hypothetical protein